MVDIYETLLSTIVGWQQQINILLADYFDLLEDGDRGVFLFILAISFLYGLVHALGPGHGKIVIASYFIAKNGNRFDAFKAGFLTSVIHTFSALIITSVLYLFFQDMITTYFKSINQNMYKVSAVFIMLIALFLLYEIVKDRNTVETIEPMKSKDLFKVALSIGVVPCPGVMSIVLYSMILGHFYLGLFSAVFMSVGMGLTISVSAIFAAALKQKSNFGRYKSVMNALSYIGVSVLFLTGGLLLV